METRKKISITFTIITFLIAGLFVSCQQGEGIDDKVQSEVEDLRDNLNDLSENDSDFADNLHSELGDFEESMNDLKEDMNETGEQISMEVRQAVNDLQAEARSLRMKLESRTEAGDDDSGMLGMGDDDDYETDNAVSGERTAQAQRDTSIKDTTTNQDGLFSENETDRNTISQDIMAEFQDFRQNVNQWVDRLSARVDDDTQRYD